MSEDSPFARAQKELYDHAEDIFLRWKREEWEIDCDKASKVIGQAIWVVEKTGQREEKKLGSPMSLADIISNALSQYELTRGKVFWHQSAEELVTAYTHGKVHNVIRDAEGFVGKFADMQVENRNLKDVVQRLTVERDKFKKMYEECDQNRNRGGVETSDVEQAP